MCVQCVHEFIIGVRSALSNFTSRISGIQADTGFKLNLKIVSGFGVGIVSVVLTTRFAQWFERQ